MQEKFTKHLDEKEAPTITTDKKQLYQNIKSLNGPQGFKLSIELKTSPRGFNEIIAMVDGKIRVGNIWYRELDGKAEWRDPTGIFKVDEIYRTTRRVIEGI